MTVLIVSGKTKVCRAPIVGVSESLNQTGEHRPEHQVEGYLKLTLWGNQVSTTVALSNVDSGFLGVSVLQSVVGSVSKREWTALLQAVKIQTRTVSAS